MIWKIIWSLFVACCFLHPPQMSEIPDYWQYYFDEEQYLPKEVFARRLNVEVWNTDSFQINAWGEGNYWINEDDSCRYMKVRTNDDYEHKYWINESGNFEWGFYVKEKPFSNRFAFSIDIYGLECHQQTGSDIDSVYGSYAFYRDTISTFKQCAHNRHYDNGYSEIYKVGKAFHVYRAKAFDRHGISHWVDMTIYKNHLILEVPEEIAYPIFVDPQWGYTDAGANDINIGYPVANISCQQLYIPGNNDSGDSLVAYIREPVGESGICRVGAYNMESDLPNDEIDEIQLAATSSAAWIKGAPHPVFGHLDFLADTTYCLAIGNNNDLVYYYYDEIDRLDDYHNATGALPAEWTSLGSQQNYTYSVYCVVSEVNTIECPSDEKPRRRKKLLTQ